LIYNYSEISFESVGSPVGECIGGIVGAIVGGVSGRFLGLYAGHGIYEAHKKIKDKIKKKR
jgi:hypothetical protein